MNDILALRNIPQELKFSGLWCGWKLTESGKVPFNLITGQHAKSNDPATFSSYPVLLQNAYKFIKEDENGKQLGGIGLGIFRGFSAIDIDHCIEDGIINPMAQEIIDYCKSYTEVSPSKTGIRIIFKTSTKIDKDNYYINNHNNGLEIYISDNTSKFVTITGNRLSETYSEINEIDITYILDKYMKKNVSRASKSEARYDTNIKLDFDNILNKDNKLSQLWYGKAPGSHSNESELDMALCAKLAYYFQNDVGLIRQYFERSPYYQSKDDKHKNKWDTVYSDNTISMVLSPANIRDDWKPRKQENPTPVQKKEKYELNDTGNARRFIDTYGNILHYNVDNGIWMLWNDSFWEYDIKGKIKTYVEIMAEQMLFESNNENDLNTRTRILHNIDHIYSSGGKESLLKEARHFGNIPIVNGELDKDTYLLCTNSGTINLQTGEIQPNRKEDLISMTTGCEIDLVNEPVRFLKFLDEMFPDSPEIIHYLQKAFGYSMTDSAREQCMFILHGDGNNGKSLLLDIIKNALGSYGITSRPQLLTEQKFASGNSEEIARLKGRRFVAIEEIKDGDKLDEQLVKSLTSGIGNQVARFLYGNSFEFPFKGKLWMATNYEPVIRGTDKGIWRRIIKIPVRVDFTGKEDRDLREKLLKELPQILGWIFKGYQMYQQEGLSKPDEIQVAIQEYREEMDLVAQWIRDCCECKPGYFEKANILYDNFRAYSLRRDQKTNQTIFGRNLGKKFEKKNYGGIVYMGIRLKKDAEDLAKKVEFDNIKVSEDV